MIRIMIVDDHEMVREGLKTILQTEPDFEVVSESGSAADLMKLVDDSHPDVVLLDARLPGVSGAEACRRLVEFHPETAVLIVSTYSDDELVDECIRAGLEATWSKTSSVSISNRAFGPYTAARAPYRLPSRPRSSIGCAP